MVTYISSYLLFFALLWLAKKSSANRLVTDDGSLISSQLLLWLHLAGYGMAWPAVLIHLALTLGYEFATVRKRFTQTTLYEDSRHRRIRLSRS